MIHELITAFMLGIIGGLIPGPVITSVFTEILQSGFARSFRIIFTAFFLETLVAVISLLAVIALDLPESVFRGLSFAGAVILIWIAISIWKVKRIDADEKVRFGFWKIAAMILSNGVLWTYWITICIPRAMILGNTLNMGEYYFMGLVQIGWLISTTIAAFIFSRFRKLLSQPRVIPVVFKIFALIFVYFAVDMTCRSIIFFTG
ncbi:MAG TPA: hypothetical protein ENN61_02825 [Bacteroidaceae bacterium]|nr:hypothetical protein [Bacteroidaceae bacterium]